MRLKNYILCSILLIFLACHLVHAQDNGKELRGVWVTNVASEVLFTKPNIVTMMDSLHSWGINVIFPVVYNNGYTLYPSLLMEAVTGSSISPSFIGRDVLAELIAEAHRWGIEVHPWIEYGFCASFGQSGGPILANNPGWAGRRYNLDTAESSDQFYWLSQAHPEVQQFLIAMAIELIQNYDIDGVQLDRIRYGNTLDANNNIIASDFGYDDAHVDRYFAETGQDPPAPTNNAYKTWRSGILNEFQSALYTAVKAENQNILVSNTPVVYPYGYTYFMQKWPDWAQAGSVDFVCPQLYRYDVSSYRYELQTAINQAPVGYDGLFAGMLIRSGAYQAPSSLAIGFVNENRTYQVKGGSFWFYEGLPAIGAEVKQSVFQAPATPPFRTTLWRPPAIITEEDDPGNDISGSWSQVSGEGAASFYAFNDTAHTSAGGSGDYIRYKADIEAAAYYDVYLHQPYSSNLAQQVPVKLLDGSGVTKFVNERDNNGRGWDFIETMYLEAGINEVIELGTSGVPANETVVADAMMLILNRKFSPDVSLSVPARKKTNIPREVTLYPNHPNPFNPSTIIRFSIPLSSRADLSVYDINGRLVQRLIEGQISAGEHEVHFNGQNLASGTYYYRLSLQNEIVTGKMLLIK